MHIEGFRSLNSEIQTIINCSEKIKKQEEQKIDWENILADVGVGTVVKHKMFGDGTVIKMDDKKKYINVKFKKGEKRFVFPDAFVNGFLTL